jgi:hypothetical protein
VSGRADVHDQHGTVTTLLPAGMRGGLVLPRAGAFWLLAASVVAAPVRVGGGVAAVRRLPGAVAVL